MKLLNISNTGIYINEAGEIAREQANNFVCSFNAVPDLYYLIYMFIFILLLLVLLKYKENFINVFRKIQAKRGSLKILLQLPNKKVIEIYKTVNKDNTFTFKNKTYCVEKMNNFIFGYDKNNLPIYLYNSNFILPLKIEQKKVTESIIKSYREQGIELTEEEISEILLRIDATILNTVYDRKLLKDLYDVSKGKDNMIIYIILGAIFLIIAYYTGLLDKLLELIQ